MWLSYIVLSVIGKLQEIFPGAQSVEHGLNLFIVPTVTAFFQEILQNVPIVAHRYPRHKVIQHSLGGIRYNESPLNYAGWKIDVSRKNTHC
jgi:hypothetical protein